MQYISRTRQRPTNQVKAIVLVEWSRLSVTRLLSLNYYICLLESVILYKRYLCKCSRDEKAVRKSMNQITACE